MEEKEKSWSGTTFDEAETMKVVPAIFLSHIAELHGDKSSLEEGRRKPSWPSKPEEGENVTSNMEEDWTKQLAWCPDSS